MHFTFDPITSLEASVWVETRAFAMSMHSIDLPKVNLTIRCDDSPVTLPLVVREVAFIELPCLSIKLHACSMLHHLLTLGPNSLHSLCCCVLNENALFYYTTNVLGRISFVLFVVVFVIPAIGF